MSHTENVDCPAPTSLPHGPRRCKAGLGAIAMLALSACANLHTINRSTDLPNNGKAVHLDAPQRVLYVMADGKACAEPTPDALQSYVSAFGGTLSAGPDSASISNALTANAASVGLHSQSITLMREHMFNICQAALNSWINDADVMLLMERSQDLTLGVLAIEQLTGTVVARPVVLNSPNHNAAAVKERIGAASDSLTTQARLDLAMKKEDTLQASLDALLQAPDQPDATFLKTALEDPGSGTTAKRGTDTGLRDARTALAQAQAERATLEQQLDDKLAHSQAAAGSTLPLGQALRTAPVGDSTAASLADASTEIVRMVLNKGHLTDMCITFMNHPKKHLEYKQHYKDVMEQCKAVLIEEMRIAAGQQDRQPGISHAPLNTPYRLDRQDRDDTPSIAGRRQAK